MALQCQATLIFATIMPLTRGQLARLGFKATCADMTCYNGMQYEMHKVHTHDGELVPCDSGLHYCKHLSDIPPCSSYSFRLFGLKYDPDRFFLVRDLSDKTIKHGPFNSDGIVKYVTDKLEFVEEICIEDPKWCRQALTVSPYLSVYMHHINDLIYFASIRYCSESLLVLLQFTNVKAIKFDAGDVKFMQTDGTCFSLYLSTEYVKKLLIQCGQ